MTTSPHQTTPPEHQSRSHFDAQSMRSQFPVLAQEVNGQPLVYLDSAATSQKPQRVIDAIAGYYMRDNANIHRGAHALGDRATKHYEDARELVRAFINAAAAEEIIFTKGTTESINLVAQAYARPLLKPGDNLIISVAEHHSNIVPWQILRDQSGAELRVAPVWDDGSLDLDAYVKLLDERTRVVALSHASNVLGSVNPIADIVAAAKQVNAATLFDGAQGIFHTPLDVAALGCDFYAFSAHKIFGPTGCGVLYGRKALLEAMPPYQGGGNMIRNVSLERSTWNDLPYKFEAGTPNIAGVVGMAEAFRFINTLDLGAVREYEQGLLAYASEKLSTIPGLRIIGTAAEKLAIVSFILAGIHTHDVGVLLDQAGVAIRTGHHCAMPLMARFQVPATARASLALYNTYEDIDKLYAGIQKVRQLFGHIARA